MNLPVPNGVSPAFTEVSMRKYGSLNHVFTSWVNMGRPDTFCGREQYLQADGHTIFCSSCVLVDYESLPADIKAKCDKHGVSRVIAFARKDGLELGYYSKGSITQNSMYSLGITVKNYPNGYFEALFSAKRMLDDANKGEP